MDIYIYIYIYIYGYIGNERFIKRDFLSLFKNCLTVYLVV